MQAAGSTDAHDATAAGDDLWADRTPAATRLVRAAVDAFADLGYHGTSTRHITARAGVSPSALYAHYRTKADLLSEICLTAHEALDRSLTAAAAGLEPGERRMRALVAAIATFIARHHRVARIIQTELPALEPAAAERVEELRRRFMRLVIDEIRAGALAGEFDVADVRSTAQAVISLCSDLARWRAPDDPRTPEDLGVLYAHLVLRMLRP